MEIDPVDRGVEETQTVKLERILRDGRNARFVKVARDGGADTFRRFDGELSGPIVLVTFGAQVSDATPTNGFARSHRALEGSRTP